MCDKRSLPIHMFAHLVFPPHGISSCGYRHLSFYLPIVCDDSYREVVITDHGFQTTDIMACACSVNSRDINKNFLNDYSDISTERYVGIRLFFFCIRSASKPTHFKLLKTRY
uniref:Uncharacterized protein n=1 Tax=Glossina brevipalpis TaxID=37001 RepID=A0A1A9WN57_9MUSC